MFQGQPCQKTNRGQLGLLTSNRVNTLRITTKSVWFPVSELIPSSEMISDDPGDTSSAIRSRVSRGTVIRSRAALVGYGVFGADSKSRCAARLGLSEGRSFSVLESIETTFHRICGPSLMEFSAVKTCVPIG